MELRHVRYFVGVAREASVTRAARVLRVAQPALSRQIRQLEEELGVALFERHHDGVRLTPAGQAFLTEARALLEHSEQAVAAARHRGLGGHAQLHLGYVWGLFHTLVPATLTKFRRACPDTAVHLFDLTATQQAAELAGGRLDAGFIGFADEADSARLEKRKVGECAFVAALPSAHRAARRAKVPLASLAEDSFFVISEDNYPGASRAVLSACAQAGFRPRILQAAERGHTLLGLVAGNCGVALVPEPLRALPHPGVVFRPLAEPPTGELFLAWRSGRGSHAVEKLLEACGR